MVMETLLEVGWPLGMVVLVIPLVFKVNYQFSCGFLLKVVEELLGNPNKKVIEFTKDIV